MPKPDEKVVTPPENKEQENDLKPPDKPDVPEKTDKTKDDADKGKIDEKEHSELRTKFTQTSQKNADLVRENEELKKKLEPPPEIPKDKGRPSTEDRLTEAKRRLKETEAEGLYDTYYLKEKVYDLESQLEDEKVQKIDRQIRDDFNSFINVKDEAGKAIYMEELDKGLYTLSDLDEIKNEVAKKGFAIDYESARDKFLSRNLTKYQEFNEKRRKAAEDANTPGGELPEQKRPDEEQKVVDILFPDG